MRFWTPMPRRKATVGRREWSALARRRSGQRWIRATDCSGEAARSSDRKEKTEAMSEMAERKIWGLRKERRGNWESEKPFDLR